MILNEVQVLIEKDRHEYRTPEGIVLSGVTSMLSQMLFPDKYAGIPQSVLDNAAARGTAIHEEIGRYITEGTMPTSPEGIAYTKLGIHAIASEYLVSDMMHVASSIDIVGDAGDGGVILYDVKTNKGGADRQYLQWQLSVYAWLFRLCNPGIRVSGIAGIWLSGDRAETIPLGILGEDMIVSLVEAFSLGLPFANPHDNLLSETDTAIMQLVDVERKIVELEQAKKAFEEVRRKAMTTIRGMLEEQVANGGAKTYEGDLVRLTLVPGTSRTEKAFDAERFRAEHPDLYEDYLTEKTTKRSGYVKVTLR